MPRQGRGECTNSNEVQVLQLVSRCGRRLVLCGDDSASGRSFDHRRHWIRDRLIDLGDSLKPVEFLFGVENCSVRLAVSNQVLKRELPMRLLCT